MKNIYKILIISSILIGTQSGCKKDFLDKKNPNAISSETFYKTDEDAVRAVNAAYAALQQIGFYQRLYHMATDLPSDEAAGTGSLNPGWYALKTFSTNTNTELSTELWRSCYQGITRANLVLENCANIDMNVAKRSRILGEAKFLRALYHFHLVINFGDVPLMVNVPKPDDPDNIKFPAKTTKIAVYDQIIQDLKDASTVLPVSYGASDLGRATKGTAQGYLGKVYLYYASDDITNKTVHYNSAKNYFDSVIVSNNYDLVPVYRDNHTSTNENNKESLFEVQFGSGYGGPWAVDNGGGEGQLRSIEFGVQGHAFHNVIPSQKLVQAFSPADSIRIKGTMFGPGNTYDGLPYSKKGATLATSGIFENAAGWNPATSTYSNYYAGYAVRKYSQDAGTFESFDGSDVNIRTLRYADILLMHAETENELGNVALAEPDINKIRDRVSMPHVPSGLSQAAMRDTIIHERMVELALEGHRYHDLKRWEKAGVHAITSELPGFPVPKYLYLPIPQTEMDVNKNLVQNPGW